MKRPGRQKIFKPNVPLVSDRPGPVQGDPGWFTRAGMIRSSSLGSGRDGLGRTSCEGPGVSSLSRCGGLSPYPKAGGRGGWIQPCPEREIKQNGEKRNKEGRWSEGWPGEDEWEWEKIRERTMDQTWLCRVCPPGERKGLEVIMGGRGWWDGRENGEEGREPVREMKGNERESFSKGGMGGRGVWSTTC